MICSPNIVPRHKRSYSSMNKDYFYLWNVFLLHDHKETVFTLQTARRYKTADLVLVAFQFGTSDLNNKAFIMLNADSSLVCHVTLF